MEMTKTTTSVVDVAAYILELTGEITTMKLQKLVYYAQAWHLVWESAPLFKEPIEAWTNGPVCPALFELHRGCFTISSLDGDPSKLSDVEREDIEIVVRDLEKYSGFELSLMTHNELPWIEARGDCEPSEPSREEINLFTMMNFYLNRILNE